MVKEMTFFVDDDEYQLLQHLFKPDGMKLRTFNIPRNSAAFDVALRLSLFGLVEAHYQSPQMITCWLSTAGCYVMRWKPAHSNEENV